jgi:hypothetical protein
MTTRRWIVLALAMAGVVGPAAGQDQQLTKPAARLSHQFSSISGLQELPDGKVLVADGIDQILVRADLATQRLDTIGRAGQGPGEYKSPDQLFPLPQGGTLLVDLGNGRLTVFDRGARYQESIPIAQGSAGPRPGGLRLILPRAIDDQGRIYYQPGGADPGADSGAVIRWDRTAGRHDTVARVKLSPMVTKTSGGPNNRGVTQRPPPYPLQEGWTATQDGRVALIRVASYRVDWVLPNGSRVAGNPLTPASVPIRQPEKKEYLEDLAANGLSVQVQNVNGQVSMSLRRGRADSDREEADAIAATEWPATKPPTTGLYLTAPDGTLWIERSVAAGAARVYDLVNGSGLLVRRVSLPVGRRAVAVGIRGLYARHLDDNGIAYLERYDLK